VFLLYVFLFSLTLGVYLDTEGFEVFTTVKISIVVFRVAKPRSVEVVSNVSGLILKIEATHFPKMWVTTQTTTRRRNPEDLHS
jgi:hypothetical protein